LAEATANDAKEIIAKWCYWYAPNAPSLVSGSS
jgi:hypothetical protein